MIKHLNIKINCGERTCASAKGKFCKFMGSIKFGQIPLCMLFPSQLEPYTKITTTPPDGLGWALRCEECLKSEEKK